MSDIKTYCTPVSQSDHRCLAFQLLYPLECATDHQTLEDLVDIYTQTYDLAIAKDAFALEICKNVMENAQRLDQTISQNLLNWSLDRLSVSTKLLLRMAIWEMLDKKTPAPVVINEYVEISKGFAEDNAPKFINGVLDKIAKQLATEKVANNEKSEPENNS